MDSKRIVALARWIVAAAALAGIVIVCGRWLHVNPTTAALTLLLYILLLAAKWGLRYAVVASLAATTCYNYFFLPPVGTFTISDPQNWLALFAFLATSVIASHLSDRIREEAADARTRQREVEVLFQLSRELLQTDQVAELMNSVPGAIMRVSGATGALLYLLEGARMYYAGSQTPYASGHAAATAQVEALTKLTGLPSTAHLSDDLPAKKGLRIAIPLRAGVKPRGVLVLENIRLSDETFDAMGGLVSIAIDRAHALEEVTRGEAAKESDRLRGVMLDSITHELRTPLTAIKASVSTLLNPAGMTEADRTELLTVIDEESDRLNHLVGQAVEMARLDTREITMRLGPQPVSALLEDIAEECGGCIAGRELRTELPAELPLVQADLQWIRRVLTNLLDNAAKYSAPGKPIVVTAERRGAEVLVSVADRGIGIDAAEQPMIFDKFYRSQTQVERIPGTGMGLAISRAIVEAHGGTITVASQLGSGSVFTFSLPVG